MKQAAAERRPSETAAIGIRNRSTNPANAIAAVAAPKTMSSSGTQQQVEATIAATSEPTALQKPVRYFGGGATHSGGRPTFAPAICKFNGLLRGSFTCAGAGKRGVHGA